MFLFFRSFSVAGRAADPDRHCAWFYHAIAFAAVRTAGEIIGLQMGLSLRHLSILAAISICPF